MPEAQCIKYPVKPGHRETLVHWIARLEDRSKELVEALAEGGIVAEAVFLETSESGDHILIYTRAEDLQAGMEALSNSKLALIQEFNQLMAESLDTENAVSLELIYHTP
jgi:Family of unknown function (DUF6176)